MYTQCPECETTFRLGANDLRRAKGKVRCGDCNAVFNALEYLAEEVTETADATSDAAADGWTNSAANPAGDVEPDLDEYETSAYTDVPYTGADDDLDHDEDDEDEDGGSILYIADDESDRADDIDDPEATDDPGDDPGDDPDDNLEDDDEDGDDDGDDDDDSEFDDAVWESIPGVGADTIRADTDDAQATPDDELRDADDDAAEDVESDENLDDLEFNVPEDKWTNFFGPLPKGQVAAVWKPPALAADDDDFDHEEEVDDDGYNEPAETGSEDAWGALAVDQDDSAAEFDNQLDDESDADDEDQDADEADEFAPAWREAEQRSALARFTPIGVTLLALALVTQLIHYNRDSLAANPEYGATLRNVYATLGSELYPLWNVNDYEIRGSEAIAGETGVDILDIRAQIANIGDNPAGLPRLRVVLRDRWANPVAAQDFGPREYANAGTLPNDGLLQPGDVIGAHISIQDPGSGAQGFELELCLPRRNTGLECTGQPFQ